MKIQINKYEENPKKYNLLAREIERRKNIYLDSLN
jgi:hypothetical protein